MLIVLIVVVVVLIVAVVIRKRLVLMILFRLESDIKFSNQSQLFVCLSLCFCL